MTGARPTALVRMADAGDLFITWRWVDDVAPPGIGVVPREQLEAAMRRFSAALPAPGDPFGLEFALTEGELASFESEHVLAQELSAAFLPYNLAVATHEFHSKGLRPHLRIQPSPRVAQLPWELLAPDPGLRLLDMADTSVLAPAGIVQAPARIAKSWNETRELPVVAVLDPRVPGFRADSVLGSVLGRMTADAPVAELVAELAERGRLVPATGDPVEVFRRTDVDREWLGEALRAGASRLLYVGHVTAVAPASGQSESATMHLACTADAVGFAPAQRDHRPLSARDLLLGTHTLAPEPRTGPELWPIPSRVALIACESGGDLRFGEAFGLISAMLTGGAELVTAGRWPLPTDLAFERLGGAPPGSRPLQHAIRAVDAAHEESDPVVALNDWQRKQLDAWQAASSIEHSPLLWAALATVDARA
ncbi:CHAT domain-containing protein [Nocardia yamanashiensis]|uniref:CHAT domain-containing protein n=1 Tax=Nocardia yamanashiensis TaxID=209247 RepID=UPI001E4EB76C|nr:CHAT domain-containing protein [Nocardia yamanashiensis]UGT45393.1 CHAT domain-containing protein [Nocardia yamanashiensis]